MKNINLYITEKLKINKDSRIGKLSLFNIAAVISDYLRETQEYLFDIKINEQHKSIVIHIKSAIPPEKHIMEISIEIGNYLEKELNVTIENTNAPIKCDIARTWSNNDKTITFILKNE